MKYRSIIYDLDGTLLDTTEGILEAVKHTISCMKLNPLPEQSLIKFIGPPIQKSFQKYYNFDGNQSQVAANIFRDYYKSVSLLKAKPYSQIMNMCKELKQKGIKQAVATYKREDYAIDLLCHYNFDMFIDIIHGADNNNILTKQNIIELCIKELKTQSKYCVFIGDSENDAIGAEKAGIDFIGVTYGFGFKTIEDVDAYPNIGVANSVEEITNFVNEIVSKN